MLVFPFFTVSPGYSCSYCCTAMDLTTAIVHQYGAYGHVGQNEVQRRNFVHDKRISQSAMLRVFILVVKFSCCFCCLYFQGNHEVTACKQCSEVTAVRNPYAETRVFSGRIPVFNYSRDNVRFIRQYSVKHLCQHLIDTNLLCHTVVV